MTVLLIKTINKCLLLTVLLLLFNKSYSQNGIIQGRLIFGNGNVVKNYKVIVVPNTKSNDKITSTLYFYGDDAEQLKKMNARTAFTTSEGKYYFKSIPPGKYILKVCTLNGLRYNFRITDSHYTLLKMKDLPATY